ncbi:MAG: phosphate-starvation-inducible PsiE family protein [archaeon]
MSDRSDPGDDASTASGNGLLPAVETLVADLDRLIRAIELVAAFVFVVLFAIGVFDLSMQIVRATLDGSITDPRVVVGFIDTGLLLLIIVEVYQTVIAYTKEYETKTIVRLVLYTGVIAMVRKAIIFRTSEFASTADALYAAIAYTVILAGLGLVLFVERKY